MLQCNSGEPGPLKDKTPHEAATLRCVASRHEGV
nr:MAG TPA: hypothetical protein [Caudoviricetes sp.]